MDFSDQLRVEVQNNVAAALAEDIGTGDLTALLTAPGHGARGTVISRQDAVLCGTAWFDACFRTLDRRGSIQWHAHDGDRIAAGQTLCDISAETRALLTAERPALNFLQLLSATATVTRQHVDAVAGTKAKIVDTRKTLPGLRLAQKYAVRVGGGTNHRLGLYDGILIKENHIIAAGGVKHGPEGGAGDRAVQRLHPDRSGNPRTTAGSPGRRRHHDPARQHESGADARGGGDLRRAGRTGSIGRRRSGVACV